jgi:K+-sensing histidine kinase KdpD
MVVVAVVAPLALCGLLVPLRDIVANTNAALLLVLLVVGVAATGQRIAGIVAALSSAVWFDVLLAAPYGQLTIADPDDVETAVLLIVAGLAVTEIALWGRRQQSRSSTREGYLTGVVTAARIVASGDTALPDLIERVTRQITDILDLDACRFDSASTQAGACINRDGTVSWNGHQVDIRRDGMPTMDEIDLPVENGGTTYGHFVLTSATKVRRPDLEQLLVVITLAEQVGAALAASTATAHHSTVE